MLQNKKWLPGEFALKLGVSLRTLRRWNDEGYLKAHRTNTQRKYYTYDQYLEATDFLRGKRGCDIVISLKESEDVYKQIMVLEEFIALQGWKVEMIIPETVKDKDEIKKRYRNS